MSIKVDLIIRKGREPKTVVWSKERGMGIFGVGALCQLHGCQVSKSPTVANVIKLFTVVSYDFSS